jgi:adenine-specific DNA-methyltransferase
VKGKYLDSEHTYADGFDENCEFLRLDYLEADDVELGRCFESIHPLLWMRAGSRGRRPKLNSKTGQFAIVEECGYAVLFDETALREFVVALNGAPGVEHVFLVTDSEDSFAEMCGELGPAHRPEMLYRDYARAFRSFVSVIP